MVSEAEFPRVLHSQEGSGTGGPQEEQKDHLLQVDSTQHGNELKVAVCTSGTPEQFVLHVRSVIHACKQIGLYTSFSEAMKAVETALLDAELAKGEYVQAHNSDMQKGKGSKGRKPKATPSALAIAKANHDIAIKVLEVAKLAVAMAGAKPFKLYGDLLADEVRQPWEKIIKAQVTLLLGKTFM